MRVRLLSGHVVFLALFATVPLAGWAEQPGAGMTRGHRFTALPTLATTYQAQPQKPVRLKDLRPDSDAPRILSFTGSTSWLDGALKGESELAYSVSPLRTTGDAGDPRSRLLRFGLTGAQGSLRYGASYREAGKSFLHGGDRAVREVWSEWQWGMTRLKTTHTDSWNNVELDPLRARMTTEQERLSLALAPPSWPEWTLAYGHGLTYGSGGPSGTAAHKSRTDSLESSLAVTRPLWSAKLSSALSATANLIQTGQETVGVVHAFTGMLRPIPAWTITPGVTWREDSRRWSGVSLTTPSATVSMAYAPGREWNLAATTLYSRTTSSDRLTDVTVLNAKGTMTWTVPTRRGRTTKFTLDAGYTETLNAMQPWLSTRDLSGLVRLDVAGF